MAYWKIWPSFRPVNNGYSLLLALAVMPFAAIALSEFGVAPIVPQHFSRKVPSNLSGKGESIPDP
jgi:hypothetical protein